MDQVMKNNGLDYLPDPHTSPMLLPESLAPRDNARQMRHYKVALKKGMALLPQLQCEQLQLHYGNGFRKSDIAKRQNRTCSAVCKSIRAGERALREYVDLYMEIFRALEKEFLTEEDCP